MQKHSLDNLNMEPRFLRECTQDDTVEIMASIIFIPPHTWYMALVSHPLIPHYVHFDEWVWGLEEELVINTLRNRHLKQSLQADQLL